MHEGETGPGFAVAQFIQRVLRVAQTTSIDPARLRLFAFPASRRPAPRRPPLPPITPMYLTSDQAKRALETLSGRQEARADDRDAARDRQRLAANASRTPAPEPKSAIPLTADSLGAQLLLTVSEQVREISREVADVARTLTHYRAFYYWFVRTANDPSAYQQLFDIAWKLALVFICALPPSGWFSVSSSDRWRCWKRAFRKRRVLRYRRWRWPIRHLPRLTLSRRPGCSDGVSAWRAPGSRWSGCPSCSGVSRSNCSRCSSLSVSPRCCWAPRSAISSTTRLVILAVVNAYALSRGLICVVRALAGPFGLFRVRAETAAYIEIWARRIVTVAVSGIAFANVALLLGLHRAGYAALLRLVMLVVHLFIVVIILQCRQPGRRRHSRAGRPRGRRGQGAQPRRRPLALSCDRSRPRIVDGVGAEYPQWLLAAAAVFRRHRCGRADRASRHHPGAEPDRSRFPHQPGSPAALPGPGDPRQSLSAAAAQHRLGDDRLHRLRCIAGSLGRRRHRLVLWRPDRQPVAVGGGDDRHRSACGGGDLGRSATR